MCSYYRPYAVWRGAVQEKLSLKRRCFLEQAIEQGEIRKNVDPEVALDLIYAPIFYRQLAGHKALDAGFTEQVLRHALRGLAK